jgi:O-antigen/teichoic acid export membrane protein
VSAPAGKSHSAERVLRRNILVGALGLASRAAHVILLLAVGRALGAAALGQLLVGLALFEVAAAIAATGFTDGTLVVVSRRAGTAGATRAVATGMLVGGAVALAIALGATWGGRALGRLSPGAAGVTALPAFRWLVWSLVPAVIARVTFAAVTANLRPEWEAIGGGAGPALGLSLALPIVVACDAGIGGLFIAQFAVQTLLAMIGVLGLLRHTSGQALLAALVRPRLDRELLSFAVPQALNMAANTYLGRLDLLVLAACGVPAATVGSYGAVAASIVELRQVRGVVSGAMAPLIARFHQAGDHAAIASALSRGARWVASLIVPLSLAFFVLHADVLHLVTPSYHGATAFPVILLVGPLVNGLGGLAGNFLVFLQRNRYNLANSLAVGAGNTALAFLLVPRFGLAGAALVGALGMATVTVLENVELGLLERLHIDRDALAPALATLAGGSVLAALADHFEVFPGTGARTLLAVALGLGAAALLRADAATRARQAAAEPRRTAETAP